MAFENKTFSSEDTLHADDMNNIMEGIVEAKDAVVGGVEARVNEDAETSTNTLIIVVKDTNGNELATTTVTLPSGGGGGFDANALIAEFNNPTVTLTDSDKTNACNYIGAVQRGGKGGRPGVQAYGILQSGDPYMINAQYGEPTANDSGNGYLTVTFYKNIIKPLLDTLKS
jgi:hypothetical protein